MEESHEYFLKLSDFRSLSLSEATESLVLRPAQLTDMPALAELMIDAYRGTIDYDGETVEDALDEVEAYLAGERGGRPLLEESRLAFAGDDLVGACLTGLWDERQSTLITYIMTRAEWKGQGVAGYLLGAVLQALKEKGYLEVRAAITVGNVPSERLFARMGFQKVRTS